MDYLDLLRRNDDPVHWEYPPGFDYQSATRRFSIFAEALSATLGRPVRSETGSHIQDASFHSQIFLPLEDQRFALIRFSNFGNMVTVSEDEPAPEPVMALVQSLLKRHGYVYVPASVLAERYTGQNPGVTGIDSWWIRFFDYV